jgi:MtN3 and saliva related transmembrane protein
MNQPTWIGLIASILTTLAAVPQLVKICREKKAENISLMWVGILFLGLCGWIYYGILKKDMIIFISNTIAALINAGIAVSAIWYKQKDQQKQN